MDTSDEYVAMCAAATEVQEAWRVIEPRDGDYYADRNGPPHWMNVIWLEHGLPVDVIWLPRQDQLQAMYSLYNQLSVLGIILKFREWVTPLVFRIVDDEHDILVIDDEAEAASIKQQEYTSQFTTLERVWLAFIMDVEHGKRWDGEGWVVE